MERIQQAALMFSFLELLGIYSKGFIHKSKSGLLS